MKVFVVAFHPYGPWCTEVKHGKVISAHAIPGAAQNSARNWASDNVPDIEFDWDTFFPAAHAPSVVKQRVWKDGGDADGNNGYLCFHTLDVE